MAQIPILRLEIQSLQKKLEALNGGREQHDLGAEPVREEPAANLHWKERHKFVKRSLEKYNQDLIRWLDIQKRVLEKAIIDLVNVGNLATQNNELQPGPQADDLANAYLFLEDESVDVDALDWLLQ